MLAEQLWERSWGHSGHEGCAGLPATPLQPAGHPPHTQRRAHLLCARDTTHQPPGRSSALSRCLPVMPLAPLRAPRTAPVAWASRPREWAWRWVARH